MLEILIVRFFKVIVLTALLVIMFALAFHLTFADSNPHYRVSPFASPITSIWKTMTMMTGEMDYESIFRQSTEGSETPIPGLPFPEIAYLLWIFFLIMMPILLSNLLVCKKKIIITIHNRMLLYHEKLRVHLRISMYPLVLLQY